MGPWPQVCVLVYDREVVSKDPLPVAGQSPVPGSGAVLIIFFDTSRWCSHRSRGVGLSTFRREVHPESTNRLICRSLDRGVVLARGTQEYRRKL